MEQLPGIVQRFPSSARECSEGGLRSGAYGGATTERSDAEAPPVEVVALVASAGGLEALSVVLRDLPEDLPAAIVIAQHLSGKGSALVPILQRQTSLDVRWAEDGMRLDPGTVTVARPHTRLELRSDHTVLETAVEGVASDRPFDALLTSLAEAAGTRALGVVMSGMGTDAAMGTVALRAAGATVIAQSEETAGQTGMPHAAAEAGADRVLPLQDIAAAIIDAVH